MVNVGTRQQGRERGANVVDVPCERTAISAAIESQLAHGRYASDPLYGTGSAGEQIAAVLARVPLNVEKKLTY